MPQAPKSRQPPLPLQKKLVREEGHHGHFTSSISGNSILLVGYSFVDDTDLWEQYKAQRSLCHNKENYALNINDWEEGLRVRGDKSFWYMIMLKWTREQQSHENIEDLGD